MDSAGRFYEDAMRNTKTIQIDSGSVVISEMTVSHVRNFVRNSPDILEHDTKTLLMDHFDELVDLFGDCLTFPDNITADDLALTEFMEVAKGFQEVNAAFLDVILAAAPGLQLVANILKDGQMSSEKSNPSNSTDQ